jgi:formylglycine-generating enzyme required for sulfatase activity
VNRGSSWNGYAGNLRSAYRSWNSPGDRYNNFGFRLVRQP